MDLYNGCHINTCQTPTPLNWYNYHLHVCFNGRLNLSVRLMKKSSHVEINLSNQFCPQLSRAFKWNNKSTSIFSCVNKNEFHIKQIGESIRISQIIWDICIKIRKIWNESYTGCIVISKKSKTLRMIRHFSWMCSIILPWKIKE